MSACGTQTVAERTPATPPTTTADGTRPASAPTTATATAPTATSAVPVTPAATATTPVTTPDGGVAPVVPGEDGGAQVGGTGTDGSPSGDEAGNRVPVSFTVAAGSALPATITVPPFLGLLLRGTSGDGRPHTIKVRAPASGVLAVPASGAVSRPLAGLPAGTYPVEVDGVVVATLRVADGAVGP